MRSDHVKANRYYRATYAQIVIIHLSVEEGYMEHAEH